MHDIDVPDHLLVQVIVNAQQRRDDPKQAAVKAAESYVAGMAVLRAAASAVKTEVGQAGTNSNPQAATGSGLAA